MKNTVTEPAECSEDKYICPIYKCYYCEYHEKMVKKSEKELKEVIKPMSEESITIGKYTLDKYKDHRGKFAIFIRLNKGKDAGEGMGVDIKEIEKLIDKFYKEKF